MKEMYKGKAFSPLTVLTKPINALETSIEVEDSSLLPAAPNYATIGDSETIKYGAVAGNILTDCIRGVEGEAAAHEINEKISRLFTALDYDTLLENVEGIPAAIADKVSEHNTAADAHQDLRGSIDEVSKAVEAFPATIDSKMDTHNTNIEAHAAIQTNISTQIDTHNTSLESHTDIRDALTEQLQLHNISESAHEDLRESFEAVSTEIETKISEHNSDLEAHATLVTRLTALEDALANPAPSASTPVGSVIQYAGAAVPEKWLKCEGQTVLRKTYPELFAAIGTKYGAGNGVTTFNLPEIKPLKRRGLKEMKLDRAPKQVPSISWVVNTHNSSHSSVQIVAQFIQLSDVLIAKARFTRNSEGSQPFAWVINSDFSIDNSTLFVQGYNAADQAPSPALARLVSINSYTVLHYIYFQSFSQGGPISRSINPNIFPYTVSGMHSIGKKDNRYYFFYSIPNQAGIQSPVILVSTEDFTNWREEIPPTATTAFGAPSLVSQPDVPMILTDTHAIIATYNSGPNNWPSINATKIVKIPLNKAGAPSYTVVSGTYPYTPGDSLLPAFTPNCFPVNMVYSPKQGRIILSIASTDRDTYSSASDKSATNSNTSFYTDIFESKDMGTTWRKIFSEYIGTDQRARIRSVRVVDDQILFVKKSGLFLMGLDNVMRPLKLEHPDFNFLKGYALHEESCIFDAAWYQNRLIVSAGRSEYSQLYLSEPNFKGFVEDMPYGIYAGRVLDR